MRTVQFSPGDRTTQLPAHLVAELFVYAENELAALYCAVTRLFGFEQAELTAEDWLRELEIMEWPPEVAIPNWRLLSAKAVSRLAERIGGRHYLCEAAESGSGRDRLRTYL
jgi:hypothetical protein